TALPASTVTAVGNTVTIAVEFRNSRNQTLFSRPDYRLYFYLQNSSQPLAVEHTAIMDLPDFPEQLSGTPGLYYVEAGAFGSEVQRFLLQVSRRELDGRDDPFLLRVVEWEEWDNHDSLISGGRTDDGSCLVRWIAAPQAQLCQITATSPVLASGRAEDFSLVSITVRDGSGQPISGLQYSDFTCVITGGDYTLDQGTFAEDAFSPGTYHIHLHSASAGMKTVAVAVMGVELPARQVEFQPGIYGVVYDEGSSQPLPNIRVTLLQHDGRALASVFSDAQGAYRILLPQVAVMPYVLRGEDPAGRFACQEWDVALSAGGAVQRDIYMIGAMPTKAEMHAYPNPARRGSTLQVVYRLPRAGHCRIQVFDLRGRRVAVLLDAQAPAGQGRISWSAQNRFQKPLAPGTYLVTMQWDSDKRVFKLVITP
ncbi:T9SS type A sorting domain-containing protein, partial [candidate division FCPU426 bacterium]|nr:T9SS type A sorting domain-containing protein [candidate division FCPU426 bacterium]